MFLVLGLFWIGLALDFSALENFLVKLCHAHLIGFTVPQILGSRSTDSIVQQVFLLKIIFTIAVILFGAIFLLVANLKTKRSKFQSIYLSIVVPLALFLFYLWYKLINEDHILFRENKIELYQITIFSLGTIVFLLLLFFRREKPHISESVASKIPSVDDLSGDIESLQAKNLNSDSNKLDIAQEPQEQLAIQSSNESKDVSLEETTKDVENPIAAKDSMSDGIEDKTSGGSRTDQENPNDDLPPPQKDALPADLSKLQNDNNDQTIEELSKVDDDLPPPAIVQLTPDLAKLQDAQDITANHKETDSDSSDQPEQEGVKDK